MPTIRLRAWPLAVWEREGLEAALRGARLAAGDIADARPIFFRFETENDVPVGFGGLEVYGADALVRSVVVLPPLRGRKLGRSIMLALEDEARARSCTSAYLLTNGLREFFASLGYADSERTAAPDGIRRSQQFSTLCPANATLMVKALL